MNSRIRYILIAIFFLVLIVSGLLIWQYFRTKSSLGKSSQIPSINVELPIVGSVSLYTSREEIEKLKTDKSSLYDVRYSYPEGSLSLDFHIIFGKFVRYQNNELTITPKENDYNLSFVVDPEFDVICWPRYTTTSSGEQIDLENIWLDPKGGGGLHLSDESIKKWREVYDNLKVGSSVIVSLDKKYELNTSNYPKDIAVVGCK